MTDELFIVTPELPGAGGVGDYTQRLLEELGDAKILIPKNLTDELPAHDAKILVQYSAYGFDRFGYPRQFIRGLIDWKKKTNGLLVIMFHEIWTFWPNANWNRLVQFFHRRAIRKLLQCADAVFTTTPSQAAHLNKLCPGKAIRALPVGSNIRPPNDVDLARERGLAVLFGLESGRVRALKQMHGDLKSLADRGLITMIVTIGAGDGRFAKEERDLLLSLHLKEGFEQRGRQDENQISKILLTASYGISAQNELSFGKSGTFMAYASHGLNVLSPFADSMRTEPMSLLLLPNELLRGLSEAELKNRAERLRRWQQQTSSWDGIAAAFAAALHLDR